MSKARAKGKGEGKLKGVEAMKKVGSSKLRNEEWKKRAQGRRQAMQGKLQEIFFLGDSALAEGISKIFQALLIA
jgi:hypothetical protein